MTEVIMAIIIDQRSSAAPEVQEILTKFGHIIQIRLGFHEVHHNNHGETGRILLQLNGQTSEVEQLGQALTQLSGVKVKSMSLD